MSNTGFLPPCEQKKNIKAARCDMKESCFLLSCVLTLSNFSREIHKYPQGKGAFHLAASRIGEFVA